MPSASASSALWSRDARSSVRATSRCPSYSASQPGGVRRIGVGARRAERVARARQIAGAHPCPREQPRHALVLAGREILVVLRHERSPPRRRDRAPRAPRRAAADSRAPRAPDPMPARSAARACSTSAGDPGAERRGRRLERERRRAPHAHRRRRARRARGRTAPPTSRARRTPPTPSPTPCPAGSARSASHAACGWPHVISSSASARREPAFGRRRARGCCAARDARRRRGRERVRRGGREIRRSFASARRHALALGSHSPIAARSCAVSYCRSRAVPSATRPRSMMLSAVGGPAELDQHASVLADTATRSRGVVVHPLLERGAQRVVAAQDLERAQLDACDRAARADSSREQRVERREQRVAHPELGVRRARARARRSASAACASPARKSGIASRYLPAFSSSSALQ